MSENESIPNAKTIQAFQYSDLYNLISNNSILIMLWGDIGIGKSTLALQLSNSILSSNKKVFYLHTKMTPISGIMNRIFVNLDKNQKYNFIFWNSHNFKTQTDIIFDWLLEIKQLESFFNEKKVGLIVIDEVTGNYLPEMLMEKKNEELNDKLNFQLATLTQISKKHKIPIILTNNFTLKADEQENLQDSPYGGKITQYWTEIAIKLERTPQSGRLLFNLTKNRSGLTIPNKWTWRLEEQGFIF